MFELQKVFPANEPVRVLQVRFLIASQGLAAIGRLLRHLPSSPANSESKNYLMAFYLGTAYEAAAAFEEAESGGAFQEILDSGWAEMAQKVARLRVDCDERNPQSRRKRLLVFARNTLSFHWDQKIVARSLERLREADVAAWAGGEDETVADTAFPLIPAIIHDALETWAGSKQAFEDLTKDVVRLGGDLFDLAHGVYATALKTAGVQG
jgi:hypothetical protein